MHVPKTLKAIAILSGTIIGAGMLSLPFITLQTGIWVMLAYLIILGIASAKIHFMFADVTFKTPDYLRFPSFAKIHLGSFAQKIAYITSILGMLGSLLAYLLIGAKFTQGLLGNYINLSYSNWVLFFGILCSLTILKGINFIEKISLWGLIVFFLSLFGIFFFSYNTINFSNFNFVPENINWFLAYGAVLFAYGGLSIIPEIEEMFLSKKDKQEKPQNIKKAVNSVIFWSFLIAFFIYSFFVFLIIGICGSQTTPMALDCLISKLNPVLGSTALAFGFFVIITSFISVGLTLKRVFNFDLKIDKNISWTLVSFLPLGLYYAGIDNFIFIVAFVGTIFTGIEGILVMQMHKKIKPKDTWSSIFILVFALGVIYEIVNFFLKW
jgi:tyrosine-specific transport protein